MADTKISDRKRKSPKRLAVVEAARLEFFANGFKETSMDKIAATANVSKRTVYDHFPSKDDLFQAIVDQILERVGEMPRCPYCSERPVKDQLLEIGMNFAETITDQKFMQLCKVVLSHFIQAPVWAHNTLKAHEKTRRDMIELFTAANDEGRMNIPDVALAATQFCGLIKESIFWPEVMAGQEPVKASYVKMIVETSVDIFLSHYEK